MAYLGIRLRGGGKWLHFEELGITSKEIGSEGPSLGMYFILNIKEQILILI